METVTIEVVNWEKYNPRSDRKSHSWLRLENSIATESKFFGLTLAQKFIAICLFAEVSKSQGQQTKIRVPWFADLLKAKVADVRSTIQHLVDVGVLRLPDGNQLVSGGITTYVRTNERTDVTDESTETDAPALPPLAQIWNRHRGGLPAIKGCTGKRLTAANARWQEKPETEYWGEIVTRMAKSDFCLGKMNKPGPHQGWKADFDFLIRPDTQHKVLEGKYDSPGFSGPTVVAEKKLGPDEFDPRLGMSKTQYEAQALAETAEIPEDEIGDFLDREFGASA